MVRVLKWPVLLATVAAVATFFAPAFWQVSHSQALTSVLVGEFAALATGHTAYRIVYGKDASRSVSLAAAVFGAVLALSPLSFGLVNGFTTVTMVGGGLVAIVGLATFVSTFLGEEGRPGRNPAEDRDANEEQARAA